VRTNLADELARLTDEKSNGATGVPDNKHRQALTHDIGAGDWVVLSLSGRDFLILLHYLPIFVQLRLQKECQAGACAGEEYFRSLVERHRHDWSLHTHSECAVSDELCTTALNSNCEDSAIIGRERNILLL